MRFRTRKHFALLVRLALEPGKRFTRDYLTDLLWPGADQPRASHSLAQGLSVIKGKVAREAVLIQRSSVGLAPGWVDVDVHHLGDPDVEVAGQFLDGFEIPAARSFEDWKDECRGRLLPQVRDCLVRQMDGARRIGDFGTVERLAERLGELDPLAEEAIRGIMEARNWAGDRTNALKAFARYEAQLAEDLGAQPGADLVRMAELLKEGRRSGPRPATVGEPAVAQLAARRLFEPETLIGREREFSTLYDAWLEARRKAPRIVAVTGDPGVGKTTLANAFVATCQMDGAVVARAQAYDAERELPFAVLGELVKQLAAQRAIGSADPEALSELTRITGEVKRQFPGVPKPVEWSPDIVPLRLADAFLKTITAAADESPVVLVVDDIHAADNASTGILHVVARKLSDARALLILTGRTSELRLSGAPAALASDTSIEGLKALEVDVLAPEAAERLVARLAARAERRDPPVERILRAASGNPLAIELLAHEWATHGSDSLLRALDALDTQPLANVGIPRAIGAVFERQISRLDATTRAAVDLAAILGRRLTDMALYAAVELSPGQAAEALSRLKDVGLLREVRGDLEFRNELIRAQAYYAVAGVTRQHLHRRVARILEGQLTGGDKSTLEAAWHYLRGSDVPGALPLAIGGAEAALHSGAPVEAERVLTAVTSNQGTALWNPRVHCLLAKALVHQSKGDSALPVIAAALDKGDLPNEDHAEVLYLRAAVDYLRGAADAGYRDHASQALQAALTVRDPNRIGRAAFEYARSGVVTGDEARIRDAIDQLDSLLQEPLVGHNAMLYLARAYCRHTSYDAFGALEDASTALRLHDGSQDLVERALLHTARGVCLVGLCRPKEGGAEFEHALALSTRVGDDSRASIVCNNLCVVDCTIGNFESGLSYALRAIAYAKGCANQPLRTSVYLSLMEASALLGRIAEAQEWLDHARESVAGSSNLYNRLDFHLQAAGFALIMGNTNLAIALTEEAEGLVPNHGTSLHDAGVFERLRAFKAAHTDGLDAAMSIVETARSRFRKAHPLFYLNVLPVKAWLERKVLGAHSAETDIEINALPSLDHSGKRTLWRAQGFLP